MVSKGYIRLKQIGSEVGLFDFPSTSKPST